MNEYMICDMNPSILPFVPVIVEIVLGCVLTSIIKAFCIPGAKKCVPSPIVTFLIP